MVCYEGGREEVSVATVIKTHVYEVWLQRKDEGYKGIRDVKRIETE